MVAEHPSPVFRLFLRLLSSNWAWGRLTLVLPDGTAHQLVGSRPGHAAVLNIRSYRFASRVLRGGDIGFAEGYMAGEWDSPDLAILLETLANNYDHIRRLFDGNPLVNAFNWLGHKVNRNSRRGSRRNIPAHYDLGNAFYASGLDETMTYSAARFERPGQSLAEAQQAKSAALARQMDLRPGHSVLEIGCGWGGFAEFAAREVGATVTGITISREQHDFARRRLFEGYEERTDFIQKYVFPGGTLPSEEQLAPVVSAAGLAWRNVERFGLDYSRTLSCWARHFEAAWSGIRCVTPRFDERFRRLWLFYLAYCEAGFQSGRTDVIQLTLGRT